MFYVFPAGSIFKPYHENVITNKYLVYWLIELYFLKLYFPKDWFYWGIQMYMTLDVSGAEWILPYPLSSKDIDP